MSNASAVSSESGTVHQRVKIPEWSFMLTTLGGVSTNRCGDHRWLASLRGAGRMLTRPAARTGAVHRPRRFGIGTALSIVAVPVRRYDAKGGAAMRTVVRRDGSLVLPAEARQW